MTKLDVLDGLDSIRICTGYKVEGHVSGLPPLLVEAFSDVEPVYEEMPGWKGTTFGVTQEADLPAEARAYLARIEALVGVPIDVISTGPDRAQTIVRRDPFG